MRTHQVLGTCIHRRLCLRDGRAPTSVDGEGLASTVCARCSDQVDDVALARWLRKAHDIQWDYENVVKRKGRLERLR